MSNRANWWYFLFDKKLKKTSFLYGVSLPTKLEKKEEGKPKIIRLGNKEIQCWHSINNLDCSKEILNHKISVIAKKSVVQLAIDVDQQNPESLFYTPVDVDVYYTNEIWEYDEGFYSKPEGIDEMVTILKILQKETGQSFKKAYSKRLGAFEYVTTKPWSENKVTPFTVDFEPRGQKEVATHRYFFERSDEFLNVELSVHLIVYDDDNEVLLDRLKIIKSGEKKVFFDHLFHKNNSGYEYWVFDSDGKLLDRNKIFFIRSISFGMSMLGNQYTISQDNLSKKSPLKEGSVGIVSHMSNNQIDFKNHVELTKVSDRAKSLYQSITEYFSVSNQSNCRWFEKSDNQDDLKKYLNQITNFQKCEAWIIDPYFYFDSVSKEYSTDYLFFLQNSGLDINVISCFERTSREKARNLESLQDYNIPLSRMSWYNLSKGEFHDRFIYIIGNQGSKQVEEIYLLSNSLNNLLKDYDLCISRLEGETKRKAILHSKKLRNKCCNNTLIWSKNAK